MERESNNANKIYLLWLRDRKAQRNGSCAQAVPSCDIRSRNRKMD